MSSPMDDLMFEAVVSEFVRPAVLTDEQLNSLHNALDDAYLHSLGPNHLLKWFTDNDFVIRHHPKPIALTPEQRAEIAAAVARGDTVTPSGMLLNYGRSEEEYIASAERDLATRDRLWSATEDLVGEFGEKAVALALMASRDRVNNIAVRFERAGENNIGSGR